MTLAVMVPATERRRGRLTVRSNEETTMGLMDKLKGLIKGRKPQIKKGIDKVASAVESKTPDKHDGKIEGAAEKAKGLVDKLPD